jgi:hypothetical protein
LNDLAHWNTPDIDQNVNVIGHYAPSPEIISFPVEITKCLVADVGNFLSAKPAMAATDIEIGFELFPPFAFLFDLKECGPFCQ